MSKHILIVGRAGFIGSHLADELLSHGYRVRALGSLASQLHGVSGCRPKCLNPDMELLVASAPQVRLEAGPGSLASWLEGQITVDRVEEVQAELAVRGLAG